MASQLELYEPLDIIGNGSFGIIRKVRRKSDGVYFARKELNFERMSERDRKQIVAEVNILKDLHNEHIVRYHDRHIDRDNGILYILMEYCGGGDLSSIIKHAQRHSRPLTEETVWNYFMQILLALQYCHHPPSHAIGRTSSAALEDGNQKRPQILHRDLKPDNVFLSESNVVKLGDFGLSKALSQASFAHTYVGTPYYMSPEVMQEKSYDSKSDIWSLGCLIYELCALKPPFHEAKTHQELSILIRNGRVPPLPRGYSQTLSNVIKSMLSVNPAMRPSASQLLQHDRIDLSLKVFETEKMIEQVKAHKASVNAREREVAAREKAMSKKESALQRDLGFREAEVKRLQSLVSSHQQLMELKIKDAVNKREEELRAAVSKREEEVEAAMKKREDEVMEAVRRREREIEEAWKKREEEVRREEKERWEVAMREERGRWVMERSELEERIRALEENGKKGRKSPFEDVQNIIVPLAKVTVSDEKVETQAPVRPRSASSRRQSSFETPVNRASRQFAVKPGQNGLLAVNKDGNHEAVPPGSAMKGVILTATGEVLATPAPLEIAKYDDEADETDEVGTEFQKVFERKTVGSRRGSMLNGALDAIDSETESLEGSEPPTPTRRDSRRLSTPRPPSVVSQASAPARKKVEKEEETVSSNRVKRPPSAAARRPASTRPSEVPSRRISEVPSRRTSEVPAVNAGKTKPDSAAPPRRPISTRPSEAPSRRTSEVPATNVGKSKSDATVTTTTVRSRTTPSSSSDTGKSNSGGSGEGASSAKSKSSGSDSSSNSNRTSASSVETESSSTSRSSAGSQQRQQQAQVMKSQPPAPKYDLADEENLPSPFLRKVERAPARPTTSTSATRSVASSTSSSASSATGTSAKRPSSANVLRAVAAKNAANGRTSEAATKCEPGNPRPSVVGARRTALKT